MTSRHTSARVAGFLYLFTMATAFLAELYARGQRIAPSDFVLTAGNIAVFERLLRIGIISHLITFAAVVAFVVALYILLEPMNRNMALLAALWRLAECLILAVVTLNDFAALLLLRLADYWQAFDVEQLQSLVRLLFGFRVSGLQLVLIVLALGSAFELTLGFWLFVKGIGENGHAQSAPSSACR